MPEEYSQAVLSKPSQEGDIIIHSKNAPAYIFFVFLLAAITLCFLSACEKDKKESLKIGDKAPDFILQDLEGNKISLSNYRNSPVVLRFFLTDCKYCRADTPVFNKYYSLYKEKGLKIIYLDSLDGDPGLLDTFKKELDIQFPIVRDKGGVISRKYNVKALPQTIIIDPQQKIVAAILGGVSEEELSTTIAPFIK